MSEKKPQNIATKPKPVPQSEPKSVPQSEPKSVPQSEQKPVPQSEQKPVPQSEQKPVVPTAIPTIISVPNPNISIKSSISTSTISKTSTPQDTANMSSQSTPIPAAISVPNLNVSTISVPTLIPEIKPTEQKPVTNAQQLPQVTSITEQSPPEQIPEPPDELPDDPLSPGPKQNLTPSLNSPQDHTKRKMNPCRKCIDSLRLKLFKLKTENGLIAYKEIMKLAKQYLYDMYTGADTVTIDRNKNDYNIEHTVLAQIIGPRPTDESFPYINKESYHDPHMLFPTSKEVNTFRANFVYGKIVDSREHALKSIETGANLSIINKDRIFDNSSSEIKTTRQKLKNFENKESMKDHLPEDDIYVDNTKAKMNTDFRDPFLQCEIGDCIFQPSVKFSGDISRIVFYYYLMYAYDVTKRPYTNDQPWIGNVDRNKCKGFKINAWEKFFFDHLNDYYQWAKNDPISTEEESRNKKIIDISSVPNIFVGYYTNDSLYHVSSFEVIDELLFGKSHDCKKYCTIDFQPGRDWVTERQLPIFMDYHQVKKSDLLYETSMYDALSKPNETCSEKIMNDNIDAMSKQSRFYESPPLTPPMTPMTPMIRQSQPSQQNQRNRPPATNQNPLSQLSQNLPQSPPTPSSSKNLSQQVSQPQPRHQQTKPSPKIQSTPQQRRQPPQQQQQPQQQQPQQQQQQQQPQQQQPQQPTVRIVTPPTPITKNATTVTSASVPLPVFTQGATPQVTKTGGPLLFTQTMTGGNVQNIKRVYGVNKQSYQYLKNMCQ